MRQPFHLPIALVLALATTTLSAQTGTAPSGAAALSHLAWRAVGPANMGGRVTAIEGIPGVRDTFYVAGADGGVFKTTNGASRSRRCSPTRRCTRLARSPSRQATTT